MPGLEVNGPEIRFLPHNPEVVGSNPTPATMREPETLGLWFLLRITVYGSEIFGKEGFSYEPQTAKLNYLKSHRRIHKI
jgi:hypothetical protein